MASVTIRSRTRARNTLSCVSLPSTVSRTRPWHGLSGNVTSLPAPGVAFSSGLHDGITCLVCCPQLVAGHAPGRLCGDGIPESLDPVVEFCAAGCDRDEPARGFRRALRRLHGADLADGRPASRGDLLFRAERLLCPWDLRASVRGAGREAGLGRIFF